VTVSFVDDLKEYSIKTWQEILDHRFIKELANDTLPTKKFVFYLNQDRYFIEGFSKFLHSAKLATHDNEMKQWLETLFSTTVNIEICEECVYIETIVSLSFYIQRELVIYHCRIYKLGI
jgi:thiaminase